MSSVSCYLFCDTDLTLTIPLTHVIDLIAKLSQQNKSSADLSHNNA